MILFKIGGKYVRFIQSFLKPKIIIAVTIVIILLTVIGITVGKKVVLAKINNYLDLGNKYLQDGKYEEAELAFSKVIKIDKKSIVARIGLGKALLHSEKFDEAKAIFIEAVNLNPKDKNIYLNIEKIYSEFKRFDDAIGIIKLALKTLPDEDIKDKLKELKEDLQITEINTTINQNVKFELPDYVEVKINTDTQKVPVKWDLSTVDTTKPGTQIINGTIEEYERKVKYTINILPVLVYIKNIDVTVEKDENYALPQKVKGKMSDQTDKDVEVSWNSSNIDTSKVGSFTYEGTVTGFKDKVILRLQIKAKTIQTITIMNKDISTYLKLTKQDIENIYGKNYRSDYYGGAQYIAYDNIPVIFFFDYNDKISNLMGKSGIEVKGTKVGMTFSQIKNILGIPLDEGLYVNEGEGESGYNMSYKINNYSIIFDSYDKDQITDSVWIKIE
jgi:hypothetical protein